MESSGNSEHPSPAPAVVPPGGLMQEEEDKEVETEVLDVVVDGVQVTSPHSNLKRAGSKKRLCECVRFSEKPKIEVFEIEEGHNFRKTPSAAKLKAMCGRWSDPFALSKTRKRIRVDEMEDSDDSKTNESPTVSTTTTTTSSSSSSSSASSSSPSASPLPSSPSPPSPMAIDPSTMTDQQIETKFAEVALEAWNKLAVSSHPFKVEHMLGDLKACGLFDVIKAKHGTVRKWFMLHPELFGLSADNFISRTGYNEEFRAKVTDALKVAPKNTMKLHQLTTDLKSQVSENGFRKALKGYDTLVNYLAAHSNDFMLSKDKMFVTIRREAS